MYYTGLDGHGRNRRNHQGLILFVNRARMELFHARHVMNLSSRGFGTSDGVRRYYSIRTWAEIKSRLCHSLQLWLLSERKCVTVQLQNSAQRFDIPKTAHTFISPTPTFQVASLPALIFYAGRVKNRGLSMLLISEQKSSPRTDSVSGWKRRFRLS